MPIHDFEYNRIHGADKEFRRKLDNDVMSRKSREERNEIKKLFTVNTPPEAYKQLRAGFYK